MKTRSAFRFVAGSLLAGVLGVGQAESGDVLLDRIAAQWRGAAVRQSDWVNPVMPHGTGRFTAASADAVITVTLLTYTREALDRGGWLNPYVGTSGYDAGHPLTGVNPGQGTTIVAQAGFQEVQPRSGRPA